MSCYFDLEQYRTARGFHLDYERVTPGPVATDFDELIASIERVVEGETFTTERRAVRDKYLHQPIGTRCELICDRFDSETA